MEDFFIDVLVPLFIVMGYICPMIGLYWFITCFIRGDGIDQCIEHYQRSRFAIIRLLSNNTVFGFVLLISYFSLTLFLIAGFEHSLWFLSDTWGGIDGDGEFESHKEGLARIASIITSLAIITFMIWGLEAKKEQVQKKMKLEEERELERQKRYSEDY